MFDALHTVGQVKSEYRRLAKLHHPDLGGDTATMQRVNAAYHTRLDRLNGQVSTGSDGKEHTYYYNQAREQAVMDKIAELLSLRLTDITIELIGVWVWVSGDTRPVKESLKSAGMLWHSKRSRWYWRQKAQYRRKYRAVPFSQVRAAYGSTVFDQESASVPAV